MKKISKKTQYCLNEAKIVDLKNKIIQINKISGINEIRQQINEIRRINKQLLFKII